MSEIIQSSSNKTIKHIKSLHMKKYRDEYGRFIIEGEKLLEEALNYKAELIMVLFTQSYTGSESYLRYESLLKESNVPIFCAEDKIFKEACETDTPQGIIAVAEKTKADLDSIISKDEVCIVFLDEVRDPGNTGTIIRTADACGLDGVLVSKGSADIYNGKTIRSTMGSLFHIPVIQNLDVKDTLSKLRQEQIVTIGADPHSSTSCIDLPSYTKSAIIIGNEAKGIDNTIKALLDRNVKIPMPGRAESLNAGIAASILMYEFAIHKRHV